MTISKILFLLLICAIFSKSPFKKLSKNGKIIQLKDPVTKGGMPLFEAQANRKSQRDFTKGGKLTLDELSQLLWAGYGENRYFGLKTAASSHAKYPFDLYVFDSEGVYKYIPSENQLEQVKEGDYRAVTGAQDFVKDAAVNIALVGVMEREEYLPDLKVRKVKCDLDAGHATYNMLLYCASAGLKAVPRALFDKDALLSLLGLKEPEYYIPLCLSAGK